MMNKNNSYNNNNNNDNDNNFTSLIPLNKVLTSCLNIFKVTFLFTESSNWFHTERPIYETLICPMLVSEKDFQFREDFEMNAIKLKRVSAICYFFTK